mmetsp:Transcript_89963/g.155810  ORF Transcript_89963/g.155810 Transcript_89963/m.155810 type:complete len:245 (-) Transcript_89963:1293-2027(-)
MVLCDQGPPCVINLDRHFITHLKFTRLHNTHVQHIPCIPLCIVTLELSTRRSCDRRSVKSLTALLCVDRCLVKHQAHDVSCGGATLEELLALKDGHDLSSSHLSFTCCHPFVFGLVVSDSHFHALRKCVCLRSLQLHGLAVLEGATCLGLLPEGLHLLFIALFIYADFRLFSHQYCEVNGEPVAGRQQECIFARDVALLGTVLELFDALVKRSAKLLLLSLDNLFHIVRVPLELREGRAKSRDD